MPISFIPTERSDEGSLKRLCEISHTKFPLHASTFGSR